MTAVWGWADKGAKAHRFPDATGRSNCGKALLVTEAPDAPAKDRCAACKKAGETQDAADARAARSAEPTPVVDWPVRMPPGGTPCPSTVHATEAVRATVSGRWRALPMYDGPVTLCGWCADLLGRAGCFAPDVPPGPPCVRCPLPSDSHHVPCCEGPMPHGRPLCCRCYTVTHKIVGAPCH